MKNTRYLTAAQLETFVGDVVDITREVGTSGSRRTSALRGRLEQVHEYSGEALVMIGGTLTTERGPGAVALDQVRAIRTVDGAKESVA